MIFLPRPKSRRPRSHRPMQRPQSAVAWSRLFLEELEERNLLTSSLHTLYVIPINVTADNVTTFHSLNVALTTPGLAAGDTVQIEPGSNPGTIASIPALNDLTIQGDPANGLIEIPSFTISAAVTLDNPGFTLKNVNVFLTGGALTFAGGATGGQILGSSIISNFAPAEGAGAIILASSEAAIGFSTLTSTAGALGSDLIEVTPVASSNNFIGGDILSSSANQHLIAYDNSAAGVMVNDELVDNSFLGNNGGTEEVLLGSNIGGVTITDNQFTPTSNTEQVCIGNLPPTVAGTYTVTITKNTISLPQTAAGYDGGGTMNIDGGTVAGDNFTAKILQNTFDTAGNGTGIDFILQLGALNAEVQGNDFHFNQIGVAITPTDVGSSAADIDLGGGTQGSTGANNFRGFTAAATATNGAIVITNPFGTVQTVNAENNIFSVANPQTVVFGNGSTILTSGNLTGNLAYVQTLYTNFLTHIGNLSDPNDAGYWVNLLNNGTSSTTVANGVLRSTEGLELQVIQLYPRYLNRLPDPDGISFYENLLQHGATLEEVTELIIQSPEYQTLHGSNANFIESLYNNILDRNGSASDMAFWLNVINTSGRLAVVQGFLNSTEYRTDTIDQFYSQLLNRTTPLSQAEVNFWVDSSLDILSIEVAFAATVEFQNNG